MAAALAATPAQAQAQQGYEGFINSDTPAGQYQAQAAGPGSYSMYGETPQEAASSAYSFVGGPTAAEQAGTRPQYTNRMQERAARVNKRRALERAQKAQKQGVIAGSETPYVMPQSVIGEGAAYSFY